MVDGTVSTLAASCVCTLHSGYSFDIRGTIRRLHEMSGERLDGKVELKKCGCRECNPNAWWMVACSTCGNKRCPHATNHENECTNSNETGQEGSVYK